MKIQIPVITLDEFRDLVIKTLLHAHQNSEKADVFNALISSGCPKLDKGDIASFLKGLQEFCFVSFEPVAIEFGENDCYWLVAGMNAMIIWKRHITIIDTEAQNQVSPNQL